MPTIIPQQQIQTSIKLVISQMHRASTTEQANNKIMASTNINNNLCIRTPNHQFQNSNNLEGPTLPCQNNGELLTHMLQVKTLMRFR